MNYNSYQQFILDYSNTFHPVNLKNLNCYLVSLGEEIGETLEAILTNSDTTTVVKELGDCLAYTALLCEVLEVDFDYYLSNAVAIGDEDIVLDLIQAQVALLGSHKRYLRGDKGYTLELLAKTVTSFIPVAVKVAMAYQHTLPMVLSTNMAKLEARLQAGTQKGSGSNR